jgi:3-oxoacyl-[acyl-carrier protein] reductase
MPGEFKDKIVVISGASRGIGRGIALAFAREGAQTVLASSSEQNLAAAAKAIGAEGPQPLTVAGDLRTLEACERLFNRVNERFRRCDVLVNNAGATRAGAFLDLPDAAWLDGFALKFLGCVRLTRLFWPLLKAAQGSVINIVGGAARTPDPEFLIGGSVNAAVANFSKGLSKLGNRDNVNVNVIHPGNTETERQQELHRQRAAALGRRSKSCAPRRSARATRVASANPRISPRWRCSCAPNVPGTSREPRSRSMAAARRAIIDIDFTG